MTDMTSQLMVTEAIPLEDGSLETTLVDAAGAPVATVTRLADGTATAELTDNTPAGFDVNSVLSRITGFLDSIATAARGASDEATRIANAARGAAAGAQTGYNMPVDLKPWLIGGAIVVGLLLLARD